ncbi:MAG: acyloxyacyl hydrolase [Pseudomonadota bacterium]
MSSLRNLLIISLLLSLPLSASASDNAWISSAAFAFGESDETVAHDIQRISFQKKWRHSWFDGGAWFLGGYWDTGLSRIKADTGHTGSVYALSLTPVFRYQRDATLSSGVTPFAEAGFGVHLLNGTHIGNDSLSTAVQFGPLLGVGIGFGERGQYELTYQYTSLGNGDIKKPNDGLDAHMLKLGYNFN